MELIAHVKRDGKNQIEKEQTVEQHVRQVSELASGYAAMLDMKYMAGLAGMLHDSGKLCQQFNLYVHGESDLKRGDIDHCYAGAKYLTNLAAVTEDRGMVETAVFISKVIASHHGLNDWINKDGEDTFERRIQKDERYQEICSHLSRMISEDEILEWLGKAAQEHTRWKQRMEGICKGSTEKETKAFYSGMLERLLQSVLVDADRTDCVNFETGTKNDLDYNMQSVWNKMHERMSETCRAFEEKTERIAQLRCDISRRCAEYAQKDFRVCRLIVPTGGGKTISSMRAALECCKRKGNIKHIYYIAPYTSILEQNADVLKKTAGDQYFLEHHSEVLGRWENPKSQKEKNAYKEELDEYELRTDKWDTPVIATTMVQFLNTLFYGSLSSVRRMHQLTNSVIIIDEVQAVPIKCTCLFNLAVNFLAQLCGTSVILCSATQPAFEEIKYPLIVDKRTSMTGDYTADFAAFRRTKMIPMLRKGGYTYEEAAVFCKECFVENGNVLFVVNTKEAASEIYQAVKRQFSMDLEADKPVILHLSTLMCPEHRRKQIREMRQLLDDKKNRKPLICITTQLIEAGVDVSFKCVIRSLAGMDNSAQAAGRCNRSGEYGEECDVYIIELTEEKIGMLHEITNAQSASRRILGTEQYVDLLAVNTMTDYFRVYYSLEKDKLAYPVDDITKNKVTLVELLSTNSTRKNLYKKKIPWNVQAFDTAGEKFQVIEDFSKSILVPYNKEAEQLILDLNAEIPLEEMMRLLKNVQKYTVGISPGLEKKLGKVEALYQLNCGAIALKKEYYSQELGVNETGAPMEFQHF